MTTEFQARSRFVPPMFFGGGSTIEPGDAVEVRSSDVRVRIVVTAVDGDRLTGTVHQLKDGEGLPAACADLAVGGTVELREEQVRSCWKAAAV